MEEICKTSFKLYNPMQLFTRESFENTSLSYYIAMKKLLTIITCDPDNWANPNFDINNLYRQIHC